MNFFVFSHTHIFFDNLHFDGDTKCGLANSISFSLSSKRFVKWLTIECVCVFYIRVYVYVCVSTECLFLWPKNNGGQWKDDASKEKRINPDGKRFFLKQNLNENKSNIHRLTDIHMQTHSKREGRSERAELKRFRDK